jgi:micrococcal nuclease
MYRSVVFLLACVLPAIVTAADGVLVGPVIKVTDGDTIKVQLSSGPISVRFDGIDAPESSQPQGKAATQFLKGLVEGKTVSLEPVTQDRYSRMVAKVSVDGQDVNAAMVTAGYAWAFRRYMRKDTRDLCRLEDTARQAKRGLWADPPSSWIYPSDWRRIKRKQISQAEDFSGETLSRCLAAVGKK